MRVSFRSAAAPPQLSCLSRFPSWRCLPTTVAAFPDREPPWSLSRALSTLKSKACWRCASAAGRRGSGSRALGGEGALEHGRDSATPGADVSRAAHEVRRQPGVEKARRTARCTGAVGARSGQLRRQQGRNGLDSSSSASRQQVVPQQLLPAVAWHAGGRGDHRRNVHSRPTGPLLRVLRQATRQARSRFQAACDRVTFRALPLDLENLVPLHDGRCS